MTINRALLFPFFFITVLSLGCSPSNDPHDSYLRKMNGLICELHAVYCEGDASLVGVGLMVTVPSDSRFNSGPYEEIISTLNSLHPESGPYAAQHEDLQFYLGDWAESAGFWADSLERIRPAINKMFFAGSEPPILSSRDLALLYYGEATVEQQDIMDSTLSIRIPLGGCAELSRRQDRLERELFQWKRILYEELTLTD